MSTRRREGTPCGWTSGGTMSRRCGPSRWPTSGPPRPSRPWWPTRLGKCAPTPQSGRRRGAWLATRPGPRPPGTGSPTASPSPAWSRGCPGWLRSGPPPTEPPRGRSWCSSTRSAAPPVPWSCAVRKRNWRRRWPPPGARAPPRPATIRRCICLSTFPRHSCSRPLRRRRAPARKRWRWPASMRCRGTPSRWPRPSGGCWGAGSRWWWPWTAPRPPTGWLGCWRRAGWGCLAAKPSPAASR